MSTKYPTPADTAALRASVAEMPVQSARLQASMIMMAFQKMTPEQRLDLVEAAVVIIRGTSTGPTNLLRFEGRDQT